MIETRTRCLEASRLFDGLCASRRRLGTIPRDGSTELRILGDKGSDTRRTDEVEIETTLSDRSKRDTLKARITRPIGQTPTFE